MMCRILLILSALAGYSGPTWADETIKVPSGQAITYIDTVHDASGPEGLTYRFRFLAPSIARDGGDISADAAEADMQALCDTFALPRLPATGPRPEEVVISLSDRLVEFGAPAPEATQYFEAYKPDDTACIWEAF